MARSLVTTKHLAALVVASALLLPGVAGAQAALKGAVPWAALTVQQQIALDPLKRDWQTIDPVRQQKWLDVAARFGNLSGTEQERVQQRMGEWARMTPDQRSRARLNFQESRQIDPEERQSRWEAYQALPAEQRRELALQATTPAPTVPRAREDAAKSAIVPARTAAPAPQAVAPTVMQARPGASTNLMSQSPTPPAHQQVGLPKITAKPGFVDPNTLLPRRGVQGAAVAAKPEPPKQ
jgi:Protein of unknown function (DUF3106)